VFGRGNLIVITEIGIIRGGPCRCCFLSYCMQACCCCSDVCLHLHLHARAQSAERGRAARATVNRDVDRW